MVVIGIPWIPNTSIQWPIPIRAEGRVQTVIATTMTTLMIVESSLIKYSVF